MIQEKTKIQRINHNPSSRTEIRELSKDKKSYILAGYAIVFNQRTSIGDYFYEEIDPHALDNADLSGVFLYENHHRDIPLAVYRQNKESRTLEISIDEKGLAFEANLDVENNPFAARVYSAVTRGDVEDMSFAFHIEVEGDEWFDIEAPMPIRRITKISKIEEISVVNEGAYPTTEVYARSKEKVNPLEILKRAKESKANNNFPLEKEKFKFKEERKYDNGRITKEN